MDPDNSCIIYDVIIVGAGPCGLATAARLREDHPSALFTDEEQARYSWIARHSNRASIKNRRSGHVKSGYSDPSSRSRFDRLSNRSTGPSMLVLDESGTEWMSRWNHLFHCLQISHLRSPMFFHPDPSDRDALLGYAYSNQRTAELQEIAGCVGKETSKHKKRKRRNCRDRSARPAVDIDERDRQDYFAPSSTCFRAFCEECSNRYALQEHHTIRKQSVLDVDYDYDPEFGSHEKVFTLHTREGRYMARTVVLAVGAGKPCIPSPFPTILPGAATHVMENAHDLPIMDRALASRSAHVLVVGGGLTSAQLADLLIRKGVGKVWLIMRSEWKVKPFDVDLAWLSKFKNHQRAAFWSADSFSERLGYVKEARNGGSMTPRFAKILRKHIQDGRLSLYTNTTISSQSYDTASAKWHIETDPPNPTLPAFQHVYFATGMEANVKGLTMLDTLRRKYPIETYGGLPALTDDLMWAPDVPLFVTGRLATLQLGPGAGNLEGARLGAERCAWAIEELLAASDVRVGDFSSDDDVREMQHRYAAGIGSRFEGLDLDP